ncbi:uncharacterized protein F5891DRAFT_771438 [Suillus fuscotomentosus]|uniref:G domain-containing protein n=1 Tax=Suillus fuscotomentosus TaxID=1912939 RepID=A0AAD4DT69_9AGAM|nr:uncharacterized protein F5891DRAFT_771438 [Suillus fuscotomentosus]KAG1893498.1 hypothetical protein F5891DRAFT_771438 [Suillus fuscotomentosus]
MIIRLHKRFSNQSHLPSPMDPSKIREKIGRFRILVIGRANAGKTTILQRICNTQDKPKIYDSAGEECGGTIHAGGFTTR